MSRIAASVVLAFALVAVLFAPVAVIAQKPSQPDIIVVMVDDLGAMDERVLERLPNISDLWLDGGLRFDAAYGETPLCCPGRASFLSGQHTRRHKVFTNQQVLRFDPTATIATALDDAGYNTLMVGKYMNQSHLLIDRSPPGWDRVAMMVIQNGATSWEIDDVDVGVAANDDRMVADVATDWYREARGNEPTFLFAAPPAPHGISRVIPWMPRFVEDAYLSDERCADIEPWKPPSYEFELSPDGFPLDDICRSLLTVDDMVGELRDIAQTRGRPTVWMFTSDNGMAWGQHGFPQKNVPWSTPLPLYFAGSGVEQGSTKALVSNIDFAPTLADLAGTTMPYADGLSFRKVLRGGGAVRTRVLENHPKGGWTGGAWTSGWWGVRTKRWHMIKIGDGPRQLYDMQADPWEMVDVSLEHPDVLRRLRFWAMPRL